MNGFLQTRSRCPDCRAGALVRTADRLRCERCGSVFPVVRGMPVLMRHDNELFPIQGYVPAPRPRGRMLELASKAIPTPSLSLGYRRNLLAFARELAGFDPAYLLVIGAGQQQAWLRALFARYHNLHVICCDVDVRAAVDLFCDAHELPFQDAVFHGVLATAVLEHVLYPERVVAEMRRVLANGGAVYSEIPFMQQVHEGAYDFTRYTLSGHRRLFNQFEEVASGVVAGPGTALVWAIEHFAVCFAPGRVLQLATRAVCRLLFFWLKYFDLFLRNSPAATDGASGTYFLGRKRPSATTSDKAIVERYVGVGRLRHI